MDLPSAAWSDEALPRCPERADRLDAGLRERSLSHQRCAAAAHAPTRFYIPPICAWRGRRGTVQERRRPGAIRRVALLQSHADHPRAGPLQWAEQRELGKVAVPWAGARLAKLQDAFVTNSGARSDAEADAAVERFVRERVAFLGPDLVRRREVGLAAACAGGGRLSKRFHEKYNP